MRESHYWIRNRVSRRRALRIGAAGTVGLAGAALIGCGGDDAGEATPGGQTGGGGQESTPSTARPTSGPMALERAPGHPGPDFGLTPISWRPRIMGGRLNMAGDYASRQNDPDLAAALAITELLCDRLVIPNGWTTELTGDLLESWEFASPEEVILRLRPGIKTHNKPPTNGRIFNAEDVAFSINRKAGILDPEEAKKYPRRAQFFGLSRAEAVDDVTTRMVFDTPNGSIMGAFADMRASMLPIEGQDTDFKDLNSIPGTGAWILEEHVEGTLQLFRANPDYYRTDDEGGRPSFDELEMRAYPDRAATLAAFLTGDYDLFQGTQPHEAAQLEASAPKGWLRYTQPSATLYHWAVNPETVPPAQDERVRQAMQLSLDYAGLITPVSAEGWLYTGPLHPLYPESRDSNEIKQMAGYNPDTKEADIAEAKKRMDAAGYPDGEGISFDTMTAAAAGGHFDTAVRIKDQWSKVFPKLRMEIAPSPDYASFQSNLAGRTYQTRVYDFAATPDVALDALTYYHSTGGRNYSHFNESWADDLIEATLASASVEERTEKIRQFEEQYIQDGPRHLPLGVTMTDHAAQPTLGGLDLVSGPWTYFYTFAYGGNHRWLWRTEPEGEVTYPA